MKIPFRTVIATAMLSLNSASAEDFTRWVDPFIGTIDEGNCFPGPCRPFGMVQPSPDTGGKVHCSGYKFTDTTVRGFSQTHLNGTGCPAMGDIAVLPLTDAMSRIDGCKPEVGIDKYSETAEVGYYAVTLANGVKCEATATERVALWRFTWPEDAPRIIYADAAAMLMQPWNAKLGATVPESSFSLGSSDKTILGYKKALGWTPYKLFYKIEFSEPWAKIERLPSDPFQGKGDRWIIRFNAETQHSGEDSLEVRIALSTVSEAGAAANMKTETDGRSFDDIRSECRREWNELLSRAQLVKGSDDEKKNWYTALYRLFIQPNVQSDADGKYRGADDAIHTAKRGHYSTFSLWDTFRATHPLYTILVPERVPGFVDSLVAFGREHGHLPMWTMWNGEAHDMIGIHSIPVIVDAWKKGLARNGERDADDLLTLMVQSMIGNDGENPKNCWNAYWENGYIPYFAGAFDKLVPKGESVSTTLELAYDWWCIADYARAIGDRRSAEKAQRWAECWKNVFDRKTGFARPRAPKTSGGIWREPFDPANPHADGNFWSDFTEANSWIYTWHVFQDPHGLAEALGGQQKALAKLDAFFATMPIRTSGNPDTEGLTAEGKLRRGQIGQYWHGNEPSHHIAYLYTLWGRRDKSAAIIGRLCRESYLPKPDGLCGNDDCGQMSAWYLFSMMGFYPVNPCGDGYVFGEAQSEEIRLKTGNGTFRILSGQGASKDGGIFLNGRAVSGARISHGDIMRGGTLLFEK